MAKTLGRITTLAIGSTVVGGGTNVSITDAVSEVDVSTPDPTTPGNVIVKELLPGIRTVSVNGDFTLVDDASDAGIDTIIKSQTRVNMVTVTVGQYKTYTGSLFVNSVSFSGGLETPTTMSLSGTFSGDLTEVTIT